MEESAVGRAAAVHPSSALPGAVVAAEPGMPHAYDAYDTWTPPPEGDTRGVPDSQSPKGHWASRDTYGNAPRPVPALASESLSKAFPSVPQCPRWSGGTAQGPSGLRAGWGRHEGENVRSCLSVAIWGPREDSPRPGPMLGSVSERQGCLATVTRCSGQGRGSSRQRGGLPEASPPQTRSCFRGDGPAGLLGRVGAGRSPTASLAGQALAGGWASLVDWRRRFTRWWPPSSQP